MSERNDHADHDPVPRFASGDPRVGAVGCLSFIGCLALGLLATGAVANYATRGLGGPDIPEAMHKTEVTLGWYAGGAIVSLVVAVVVAFLCTRWMARSLASLSPDS
jgi:hypothetical protein